MDTGLLNLGEEHFSSYYVRDDEVSEPRQCGLNQGVLQYDSPEHPGTRAYFSEWEDERELNGDIGLIPEASGFCDSLKDVEDIAGSPPSVLFQKMLDWSTLVYMEGVDGFVSDPSTPPHSSPYQDELSNPTKPDLNPLDVTSLSEFDITKFLNDPPSNSERTLKAPVKKIDKEAQQYIIDQKQEACDTSDDLIDVETVSEGSSLPVLEASDAFGLLEQFEASEKPIANTSFSILEKIPKAPIEIFENEKKEAKEAKPAEVKNKQILEALPQELIARINESGKRKPITVIPAIPAKKRGATRSIDSLSQHKNKVVKSSGDQVKLEHDYCSHASPYPKEPRKDSGFQSSEEDDRTIIRNQPTVKNADGKLMVSLLKINTIRNNTNQKKKLNLEEYKKRRFIKSDPTSSSSSPLSSTCSSPLPEDENVKRLKHQEKLMKMAADLLNTPPPNAPKQEFVPSQPEEIPLKVVKVEPPPDLEVKTYVSIGTNTDISSINNNKTLLASAKQLEEIKPLLQKVSDKINSNSFITSLIENIPKLKTQSAPRVVVSESREGVHEDKIIHYLKKDRKPMQTSSIALQTDFVDEETAESRYRRRISREASPSSSSERSGASYRSRRCSSSSSSRSSSSSSSRSSSRSPSPKRQRHMSDERLREVEERRVIYVGRIAKGTTNEDLRRRFQHFGLITNISLHFREYGDNYGFVTFANKEDAYDAMEHGNDGYSYPIYDLSFGGRRIFCKTTYSDLDNMREDDYSYYENRPADNSFDALLRAAQKKIRERKS